MVNDRSAQARKGALALHDEPESHAVDDRAERNGGIENRAKPEPISLNKKGRSLGPSLAGSFENERAELLVDIPVWSPGCFQGECRSRRAGLPPEPER
jgi:hypothetical protein